MDRTTIKANGGWTIELSSPVDGIKEIDLSPLKLDHTIRWAQGHIPSVLALISELSGVKEKTLKQLSGVDTDRLFLAFSCIASGVIKKDFEEGTRPLATAFEQMSDDARYDELDENDPDDPRFPKINEPVRRFETPPETADETDIEEQVPDGGMNVSAPNVMKKVG